MDVLPNALPEQFFVDASDECLKALATLVDVGIAKHLMSYCDSSTANPGVVGTIERYFSNAIKHATYHQELHDAGIVAKLKEINLDAVAAMTSVADMEAMVADIKRVTDNIEFVHARIQPRSKEDYEKFFGLCPSQYQQGVANNRDYFYYPRAKETVTGLGYILSHRQDYDVALKGLLTRLEFAKHGGSWEEGVRKL